jgi:hypothetical protein
MNQHNESGNPWTTTGLALAGGILVGAGLMYLVDPNRGRRRRAQLHDRGWHLLRKAGGEARGVTRNTANHLRGVVARGRARFRNEEVDNEVLIARVRSRLVHVVSHPHALTVRAATGQVTIGGPIPAEEVTPMLEAAGAVPGVAHLATDLRVYHLAPEQPGPAAAGAAAGK